MCYNAISSFDIDGVIFLGGYADGLTPGPNDVIITGRSVEEKPETMDYMLERRIFNQVYFNPLAFNDKSRSSSGHHKAKTINDFNRTNGFDRIVLHYEDDPIQVEIIRAACPDVFVVHVNTNGLINLENKRHHE